mgnify:CR=1 FL=1
MLLNFAFVGQAQKLSKDEIAKYENEIQTMLSYLEEIPVCVAYELRGERIDYFPSNIDDQNALKPVYEYLPGFRTDISGCRRFEDLPVEARNYIRLIEEAVVCPIQYVSVGTEREAYIRLF